MSYDLHIEHKLPLRELRHNNITYNIDRLMKQSHKWVGIKLKDLNDLPVWDVALVLSDICGEWNRQPKYFQQFEVENWGNLMQCLEWSRGLVQELDNYPRTAILRVYS
jgi:hypothetical protein